MEHADLLRLDAEARLTPSELRGQDPELLARLREVELERAKQTVVERFADAPVELRTAVAELEVEPGRASDVRSAVLEALRERGVRAADVVEA